MENCGVFLNFNAFQHEAKQILINKREKKYTYVTLINTY